MKNKALGIFLAAGSVLSMSSSATETPTGSRFLVKNSQEYAIEIARQESVRGQINSLRKKVLKRCGLPAGTPPDKLPWYFHYELALELAAVGHNDSAIVFLQKAAEKRFLPKANKRTYGMWFVDYLPYYQMAASHAQMGNWFCADKALEKAERFREYAARRELFEDFDSLRKRIRSNLNAEKTALLISPTRAASGSSCA